MDDTPSLKLLSRFSTTASKFLHALTVSSGILSLIVLVLPLHVLIIRVLLPPYFSACSVKQGMSVRSGTYYNGHDKKKKKKKSELLNVLLKFFF